jgi:dihydrofolate synthase/folylpolyglutamate synthase
VRYRPLDGCSPERRVTLDYDQALAALLARGPEQAGVGPSLVRMQRLAELLDHPERTVPAIHLTGTNGKTTTARMVAALLAAFGIGAGTYTSPHLQDVRERIAVAGRPIAGGDFAATWAYLEPYFAQVDGLGGNRVTFFEALTILAFTWFAEVPVDVAVVEVGMGGEWDATNLVRGEVAVLTRVSLDHPELGATPAEIAVEKAGIVKDGATVVTQAQEPAVLAVITERADKAGARLLVQDAAFGVERRQLAHGGQVLDLRTPAGMVREVYLPLHGRHQAANAATALAAVQAFLGDRRLDEDTVRAGFAAVSSPGRLEVVGRNPLVLLDGAHNPAGAAALAEALLEEFVVDRRTLVVGALADKDLRGILRGLAPATGRLIVTANASPRSAAPEQLRTEAEALGLAAETAPTVPAALDLAREGAAEGDAIVVTGSLYTVGEARTALLGPGPA